MGYLLELLLFLLCGIGLSVGHAEFMWIVCAALIALTMICIALTTSACVVKIGIAVGCLVMFFLFPDGIWFLPAALYLGLLGAEETKRPNMTKACLAVVSVLTAVYVLRLVGQREVDLEGIGETSPGHILLLFLILVLAALLEYRSYKQETLQRQLLRFQDDTKEQRMKELLLRQKEEEQHGYEVHLAALSERNRIAREIHDNVGHLLSRSLLQLGAILTINKNETLQPLLQELRKSLDEAMTGVRSSVHDLHNEAIDLESALSALLEPMGERYRIQFDYDVMSQAPRQLKYTILGVVKEALSNVVKHSDATEIHLLLREQPAFYQLVIEDNGTAQQGKGAAGGKQEGIGLINMRERVSQHRGTLAISTENGFRIFIMLPKQDKERG